MIQLLLALLLLLLPGHLFAALPPQLENDFSPLEGYIVLPMGNDDYLIDLDASKGARTGDIFSIIRKGEKITHPVSGEVIGNLDGSSAFLQVTRLKSGYSYVRKLGGNAAINKGDRIQRFTAVPVQFVDKTGDSQGLMVDLQMKLVQLDWLGPQSTQTPLLIFERAATALTVRTPAGATLFSYPMSVKTSTQPQNLPVSGGSAPQAIMAASQPEQPAQGIIKNQTDTSRIWHGADYKDEVIGLRVEDFNNDGRVETALLLKEQLVVSSYTGTKVSQIAAVPLKGAVTYLALDSLDLNGNGRPELFLSAVEEGESKTRVYELVGQKLEEIASDLPLLVRRIDHPTEGPILLGQRPSKRNVPYSGRPVRVIFSDGKYQDGGDYPLPAHLNIYGFTPLAAKDNAQNYAYLSNSQYLKIKTAADEDLFESAERFGSTEIQIDLLPDSGKDLPIHYFLPQRLVYVNGEIIVPLNEGILTTQTWRRFNKSRLVSLTWNGLALDENWRTSEQSGHTADFAIADIDNDGQAEVVLAVKFSRKEIFSSPRSAVVVYEMQ